MGDPIAAERFEALLRQPSNRITCGSCGFRWEALGMTLEDLSCAQCAEREAKARAPAEGER